MTVLSYLKLSQKPSNDELVAKFNMLADKTNANEENINKATLTNQDFYVRFEKRMDQMENNLSRQIDKQAQYFNEQITEIKHENELDEVKEQESFIGWFNISGKNAILKILEYGILILFTLGLSMFIKK